MRKLKRWDMRRTAIAAALFSAVAITLVGAVVAALVHPQPLFSYGMEQGRLALYSDRPFDRAKAVSLLAEVEQRIARSWLDDHDASHRIFVVNASWRRGLLFLWNSGAAGVNYYPLTHNVFIRSADIDGDRVFAPSGEAKAPPWTLTYYAAHEIAHSLIKRQAGFFGTLFLPRWINEGLADRIGLGGDRDLAAARVPEGASGSGASEYDRYRQLVSFFLQREGWTPERLIASRMTLKQAEEQQRASQVEE